MNIDDYFDKMYEGIDDQIHLDKEQKEAILCDEQNTMIIAGAGSGKTTTMASKVKYLIDIKKIPPQAILVISFTNQATLELQERINQQFGYDVPILTFHKLGLHILEKSAFHFDRIVEDPMPFINKFFYDERSNKYLANLFLLCHNPYRKVLLKTKKQLLENNYLSLSGDYFKDDLTRHVANLLYLYQIPFTYHKKYSYKQNYYPDFTLENDIYIECFNNTKLRKKTAIIRYHKHHKTKLLIIEKDDDIKNLKDELAALTYLKPLSTQAIRKQLFNIKKYSSSLLTLCADFLKNFKIQGRTLNDFALLKQQYSDEKVHFFLDLMQDIYLFYEQELKNNRAIDFDDMIIKAREGLDKVTLPYRYIIVDEYQDISSSRFLLIKELAHKCQAKLVAVGDDFQSIFAFAGSDITLFTNFQKMMGTAKQLKITHTYRNSQELIQVAGNFVMINQNQIAKTLVSPKKLAKPIRILLYDDSKKILNRNRLLIKTIDEIISKMGENKSILLLGRYNFEKRQILQNKHLKAKDKYIIYDKYPKTTIVFLSVHSAKGLGYDNVIIVNMEEGVYGFPSQIQDSIFKKIGKKEEDMLFGEERRLFYVALTRTKNYVYLLTPAANPSRFVLEISHYPQVYVAGNKIKKSYS